jgi:hypothetical protein
VTYVWGDRGQPWPSQRPDAVRREFQDLADGLITQVEEIVRSAKHVQPTSDLAESGALVVAAVRERFPQLSYEALRAIGNLYTYGWR